MRAAQPGQIALEPARLHGQRRGVHAHAGPFDRRQHVDQWQLHLIGHGRQALGLDRRRELVRQLAREVGSFGGHGEQRFRRRLVR